MYKISSYTYNLILLKSNLKNMSIFLNSFKTWVFCCIVCKFGANTHFHHKIEMIIKKTEKKIYDLIKLMDIWQSFCWWSMEREREKFWIQYALMHWYCWGTRMEASLIVRSALIWIQTMLHWKKARKGTTKEDCGFKSGAWTHQIN